MTGSSLIIIPWASMRCKSVLIPTHKLVYLGFKIDNCQMTIQFILAAHDQLVYLLWYKRQGSLKDRQKIACYTQWILFNLQLPHFLAKDILLGDPTWVLATLCDLSVLSYNPRSS